MALHTATLDKSRPAAKAVVGYEYTRSSCALIKANENSRLAAPTRCVWCVAFFVKDEDKKSDN